MEKITYKQYEDMYIDTIINYLKSASPKERHQLVQGWNWDSNSEVLTWIANDPSTDKATALKMYWMAAPGYYKQYASIEDVPKYAVGDYNFVINIETKYVSGFYKNHNFAFDPDNDEQGEGWTAAYPNLETKSEIPAVMYEKLTGEEVAPNNELEDGIPLHIYNELIQLYERIDPKL